MEVPFANPQEAHSPHPGAAKPERPTFGDHVIYAGRCNKNQKCIFLRRRQRRHPSPIPGLQFPRTADPPHRPSRRLNLLTHTQQPHPPRMARKGTPRGEEKKRKKKRQAPRTPERRAPCVSAFRSTVNHEAGRPERGTAKACMLFLPPLCPSTLCRAAASHRLCALARCSFVRSRALADLTQAANSLFPLHTTRHS